MQNFESNPYAVVKQFEQALCDYTGAPYAVTVTSCTEALMLAVAYHVKRRQDSSEHSDRRMDRTTVTIPNRTYVGVPAAIIHGGGLVRFRDEDWLGAYQLSPLPVWDCALLFTSDMYIPNQFQCVSFHWRKTLSIGQGGAILHDDPNADAWFRRMRFDGRTEGVEPKNDNITEVGFHCFMSPRDAAEGLSRLAILPRDNEPLPNDEYPDLSRYGVFTK